MPRLLLAFLALLPVLVLAQPPDLVAPTEALTPEQERAYFKLPPGWEVQLVAAEPDINKPMNLAFDAKGRLWVTSTVEYPWPVPEGKTGRDTLKVLSDFGPNGRARKIETFADGLNIPIGVLPLHDRVLVHSIPHIWEMKDTDGDGKADVREPLITGVGFRDTHGMTNAFTYWIDGWVYACHGFANDSLLKGRDGSTLKLNSGNVYRFRPEGTKLEQFTWGQVNPFGLAFDKWGNLFSADCHSRPISLLLRGGCYSSFGKPHDGLGFVPDICKHDHGSTGIAGIVCLETDTVPPAFRGNLLIGNVVTNRINRDSVVWDGDIKGLKEEPDFLVSGDPWFRPVDLKLGPDGAIYVADFYNCIIGHYEVDLNHPRRDRTRGRIWRFVYTGKDATPAAAMNKDWTKANTRELMAALGSPNLTVRTTATQELVRRQDPALESACSAALASQGTAKGPELQAARAAALWILERKGQLSMAQLRAGLTDEPLVAAQAIRLAAERPGNLSGWSALHEIPSSLLVQRLAAQLLSKQDSPDVPVEFVRRVSSSTLARHSLKLALREQWERESRGMDDFRKKWPSLFVEAALGVRTRPAAEQLAWVLDAPRNVASDRRAEVCRHIARYGDDALVARSLSFLDMLSTPSERLEPTKALWQGCQARGANLPPAAVQWAVARGEELLKEGSKHRDLGCRWAEELQLIDLAPRLKAIAEGDQQGVVDRAAAAAALAKLQPQQAVPVLFRLWHVAPLSTEQRQQLIAAFASIPTPEGRAALVELLSAAPADLQLPLALGLAATKEGAEQLLVTLEAGKASARLLQDRGLVDRLRHAQPKQLDPRLKKLTADLPTPDAKLHAVLLARLELHRKGGGDVAKGKVLFEKNCGSCHQLGGQGGKVGPQLDGIGSRGADRLAEDLLDPNRNVDQAFRATLIALDNGKLLSGLLLREEGETYILADEKGNEVRIAKKQVEEKKTLSTSPMPAKFDETLKPEEFRDLLAFLLAQRK